MLYNIKLKRTQFETDCISCPHFNKVEKKCEGLGKCCLEIDPTTQTIIDPVTKLPIKIKEERRDGSI